MSRIEDILDYALWNDLANRTNRLIFAWTQKKAAFHQEMPPFKIILHVTARTGQSLPLSLSPKGLLPDHSLQISAVSLLLTTVSLLLKRGKMKKKGSTSDFARQRDRELYESFKQVLATSRGVALRDMFGMAAARPASRFWVSEERAAAVIGAMMRDGVEPATAGMFAGRRAMYEELFSRVIAKMTADPSLCMTHAVGEAVCEPAPCFYLTDKSAKVIIYRIRQRAAAERLMKSLTLDPVQL